MGTYDKKSRLDYYYQIVQDTVLKNQNEITGLIPISNISNHAWIRDNSYAVLSVWALSLAYRKVPDVEEDRSRGYELERCVVKIMRGILSCLMRQSEKVQRFKVTQHSQDSIHAKFNAQNFCTVVGDYEWGHLQIDAISLYLLNLAQITTSGIRCIWTTEEVAFIQNLIFYIELAYRIPDYGIWERGDKTNHGLPELNSSSVGMAKAALEAMNELDLFGAHGGSQSTIHVIIDESHQCGTVLESMLPRESYSKETDAALLAVIGYPAFAVDNDELIETTRNTIISKLEGRYGCKRFLRDGFRTACEDANRLHYEPWELRAFDKIECEWPLFFCYLQLEAQFRKDYETANKYDGIIDSLLLKYKERRYSATMDEELDNAALLKYYSRQQRAGNLGYCLTGITPLVPESYQVSRENLDNERARPGTQKRAPVGRIPHLWGQSLYILTKLIQERLLLPGEIDPLGRRLVTEVKPDLVVQICAIAENETVQKLLKQYGLDLPTFTEISERTHIRVFSAKVLIHLYRHLGKCCNLKLTGRASNEIGALTTSRLYLVGSSTVVFTPQFLDYQAFYLSLDTDFVIDNFRNMVAFLRRAWNSPGRPLLIIPIYEAHVTTCHSSTFHQPSISQPTIISTLKKIQSGFINGTRVVLGQLQDFMHTSCTTKMAFLRSADDLLSKIIEKKTQSSFWGTTAHSGRVSPSRSSPGLSSTPPPIPTIAHSLPSRVSSSSRKFPSATERPNIFRRKSVALTSAIDEDLHGGQHQDELTPPRKIPDAYFSPAYLNTFQIGGGSDGFSKKTGTVVHRLRMPSSSSLSQDNELANLVDQVANDDNDPIHKATSLRNLHARRLMSHNRLTQLAVQKNATPSSLLSLEHSDFASSTNETTSTQTESVVKDPTTGKSAEELVVELSDAEDLYQQVELLHIIHSLKGMDWDTGLGDNDDESHSHDKCTVRDLIREVYDRAGQNLQWMALRFTGGLLQKHPDNLARALTDILVRQKQVTVGLPPEPRERVIMSPLPPDQLVTLINEACTEDYCMAMLTQEIIIYLSMFCQTQPQLLASMLRIRVGLIIQVMASELSRSLHCSAEEATLHLFSMGPFQCKTLLHHILSGQEFHIYPETLKFGKGSSINRVSRVAFNEQVVSDSGSESVDSDEKRGQWLRRRKIDGALNRVPPSFYELLWHLLDLCPGVRVGSEIMNQGITREMTENEIKFALTVEGTITRVPIPEYRQLVVECLYLMAMLVMNWNKDNSSNWKLHDTFSADDAILKANQLFLDDQMVHKGDATACCAKIQNDCCSEVYPSIQVPCMGANKICIHFYDSAPSGRYGTMTYILRALTLTLPLPLNADSDLELTNCCMQ